MININKLILIKILATNTDSKEQKRIPNYRCLNPHKLTKLQNTRLNVRTKTRQNFILKFEKHFPQDESLPFILVNLKNEYEDYKIKKKIPLNFFDPKPDVENPPLINSVSFEGPESLMLKIISLCEFINPNNSPLIKILL